LNKVLAPPAQKVCVVWSSEDLGKRREMGGYGSGWRGPRKYAVEECIVLSMSEAIHHQVIVPGARRCGTLAWGLVEGQGAAIEVEFESDALESRHATLGLTYYVDNRRQTQWIYLSTGRPHFGGVRWWFRCPLTDRCVSKLYVPPNDVLFASRHAHDLTYRSCQISGTSFAAFRQRCISRAAGVMVAGVVQSNSVDRVWPDGPPPTPGEAREDAGVSDRSSGNRTNAAGSPGNPMRWAVQGIEKRRPR
jgi:hypothetical protein